MSKPSTTWPLHYSSNLAEDNTSSLLVLGSVCKQWKSWVDQTLADSFTCTITTPIDLVYAHATLKLSEGVVPITRLKVSPLVMESKRHLDDPFFSGCLQLFLSFLRCCPDLEKLDLGDICARKEDLTHLTTLHNLRWTTPPIDIDLDEENEIEVNTYELPENLHTLTCIKDFHVYRQGHDLTFLTNLQKLDLFNLYDRDEWCGGHIYRHGPDELHRFSNSLTSLSLTGIPPDNSSFLFGGFENLTHLHLRGIAEEDGIDDPYVLSLPSRLTSLCLDDIKIYGDSDSEMEMSMDSLIELGWAQLKTLSFFDCRANRLLEDISILTGLTSLSVVGCDRSLRVSRDLKNMTDLQDLYMDDRVDIETKEELEGLERLTNLRELYLKKKKRKRLPGKPNLKLLTRFSFIR